MSREFNVTGTCIPGKHYCVELTDKLGQIFQLIEQGRYFTINRPRQYGKTTTLYHLIKFLQQKQKSDYFSIRMSFEGIGAESYQKEATFIQAFLSFFRKTFLLQKRPDLVKFVDEQSHLTYLYQLGDWITELISLINKKVVLFIDEVDQASNLPLFLDFLGMLRRKYLLQNEGEDQTFHSVILAGVHDIKSLKVKFRAEEEQQTETYNSPWNIATDFEVDMSFSPSEIATMLEDYSQENQVAMNIQEISEKLHYYTSGYPFLVSKLCKIIDEKLMESPQWSLKLVELAVQQVLTEENTNFESLIKNLENHEDIHQTVFELLLEGIEKSYNINTPLIKQGVLYGIFKNDGGRLVIHNRIYQLLIYQVLSSKMELAELKNPYDIQTHFLQKDGHLNLEAILLKFQEFMQEQYSKQDHHFLERNGRLLFLSFLRPILNGKGFAFKEVEISEEKRLDITITYLNQKYIVELKIWRGESAHQKGIQQLCDYLERQSLNQGYLVIFDFRKNSKEWKQETKTIHQKEIFMIWV